MSQGTTYLGIIKRVTRSRMDYYQFSGFGPESLPEHVNRMNQSGVPGAGEWSLVRQWHTKDDADFLRQSREIDGILAKLNHAKITEDELPDVL